MGNKCIFLFQYLNSDRLINRKYPSTEARQGRGEKEMWKGIRIRYKEQKAINN